jgi:hypothetical protein
MGVLGAGGLGCEAFIDLDYGFADSTAVIGDAGSGGGAGEAGAAALPTDAVAGASAGVGGSSDPSCGPGASTSSCPESTVTLEGSVVQLDTQSPLAGVRVGGNGAAVTTDASGRFSYSVTQPDSFLELILTQPGDNGISAFQRTVLRLDDPREASHRTIVLPSVLHEWRVTVAKACGALDLNSSDTQVRDYFNQRSTLVVEVPGTAGIVSSQISVKVTQGAGSWTNTDNSSLDVAPAARVCFLEKDPAGHIIGGTGSATTDLGLFVMFRVRNDQGGGGGLAEVNVTGHGSASLNFNGAGQSGIVRLGAGW